MMAAVWVAVVVAAAFWVIAVCVGVYVMLAGARLISHTTATVISLRERSEAVMEQAEAVTRRAGEQVARTEAITASMDEVTTSMADLNGRLTELGPAARSLAEGACLPLARIAAAVYGIARAIGMRRAGAAGALPAGGPSAGSPGAFPGRRRRPALAGRRNGGQR
jgi:hypothetical protein